MATQIRRRLVTKPRRGDNGIYTIKTVRKKTPLTKLSKKIKRLVEKHGTVKLEVYGGRRPYGLRTLKKNGECVIHYADSDCYDKKDPFAGRGTQHCCFMEDYSVFHNDNGDEIIYTSLNDTLRAMQRHDSRHYKIKVIRAGGRRIKVR